MRVRTLVASGAALALGLGLSLQRGLFSQPPAALPALDDSVISIRVQLGVNDPEPSAWDGSLNVSNGEIVALRNWRPRPGDRIDGLRAWSLATRKGLNFVRRAWEEDAVGGVTPYLNHPGLILDVKASPSTSISFETKQGSFVVTPRLVETGRPMRALNGRALIDRVATAQNLALADQQNDHPSITAGQGGELWMAWVTFRDGVNEVWSRRFDGSAWSAPRRITPQAGDIFLVKVARDGKGRPWAVWSQQVDGNFDLYGSRFENNAWSTPERLTTDPQPDLYQALTTDSFGNLWLVWQGFRNGKSDVFARRYDGSRWSEADRVSISAANDWEPSIAADSTGNVHVAWDSYDKGNYDVWLRTWSAGKWSDATPVAETPKYEAHVSLACDRDNRLWAVWNESGFNWGKDSGFLVKKEATRLYQSRWIGLAVNAGGKWQEPAAEINQSLPVDLREYNDFPIMQVDAANRPWVFFRHRNSRMRDIHSNAPNHRSAWEIQGVAYEGDRWSASVAVPFTPGRTDVRGGFALDGRGNLYAAWATDNRDYEEFLFQRSEVYAGRLPAIGAEPAPPALRNRTTADLKAFPVHQSEPQDLQRIRNYAIQSEGATYRIYRGDTHRHTEISMDGNNDGTLHQAYRYALDAAELDFMLTSEHNGAGGPDLAYVNHLMQQTVDLFTLPGRFAPFYGYERSVVYPNGHRNILFAKRGVPTLPIPQAEQQGKEGAQALYEYLKKNRGIAISHTSATNMGTDWRDNDPAVEPLVEIYQGDRVSAEYEGAPKAAHRADPGSAPGGFRPAGYVWNALAKGYKLGIQAASDHLSTHISYACTLATDFSREGLLDAMRKRHSYGATDNIVLDYRLQTGGKEYLQGDIVKVSGAFQLSVKVIGTNPVRQIDIVRNNTFVHNRNPMQNEVAFSYVDNQPLAGESYYYVRAIQVDDQIAWSSPIWVTR